MTKLHKSISVFVLMALLLVTPNALAAPGDTTRVSVDSSGAQGNGSSGHASISSDGRYVAFTSYANNLVTGDSNDLDAFVHDRATGITTRVSVDSSGAQANNDTYLTLSFSSNGRYVAFISSATNLVAGDTNRMLDAFVHDCITGVTSRVSVDSSGTQGNHNSFSSSISSDGRYVAFMSTASNLVAADTNGQLDVFIHDRTTGITSLVSVDSSGAQGNGYSHDPSISSDGRYVAFWSYASNLVVGDTNGKQDIFVNDRNTAVTTRVSVGASGAEGNGHSYDPSISSDGRYVVFVSDASNLVSGDTNGMFDVFMHDRATGITMRASVDSLGVQGNGYSSKPSVSSDGQYVVFTSDSSNLTVGDTNGKQDIFVHDSNMGTTIRVSVDSSEAQGNDHSYDPSISSDGRYVAFTSHASNLVSGDTNWGGDVFVHELGSVGADSTLPRTGFAPNVVTLLPSQPAELAYTEMSDLWLEIPSQKIKANIVGVPKSENGWDVKWLGQDAGWLNGTAFPTWEGNSVITAHVTDDNGLPGPFANLKDLNYGEQVIVHLYGQQYIFEIRNKRLVRPEATGFAFEHLEKHSYLTLITCQSYDPATDSYRLRRVIRAVLVEVK
jgi:LPXTG-site transpeptidase (sortase) family protein